MLTWKRPAQKHSRVGTDQCNQNCRYCYVAEDVRRSDKRRIPLATLERFYRTVLDGTSYDNVTFIWHGGEPSLVGESYMREAIALQSRVADASVTVRNGIQTNATALTDGMIALFEEKNVSVGISIDAPPRIHDQMRVFWSGRSTLNAVLSGVDRLRSSGISCGAICVLHRYNFDLGAEIYKFFKSLGLSYKFNPFYKDEGGSDAAAIDLAITPEQYAVALNETYDCWVSDPSPDIEVSDLKDIVTSMFLGYSRNCLFAGNCSDFLGVLPTGESYLCDMFYNPSFYIGNIGSLSADQIKNSDASKKVRLRPMLLQQSYCKGCEWWNICRGGCTSKSAAVYGDAFREDPFCRSRKSLFQNIKNHLTDNERKRSERLNESGQCGSGCGCAI